MLLYNGQKRRYNNHFVFIIYCVLILDQNDLLSWKYNFCDYSVVYDEVHMFCDNIYVGCYNESKEKYLKG